MAHPGPARPKETAQLAKLALLGVGTLATGAFGVLSLAAGYKLKKSRAPDPSTVTPLSYLEDLTHLIPPWDTRTSTGDTAADGGGSVSPLPSSPGAKASAAALSEEQRAAEVRRLEVMGEEEEAELHFRFDSASFAHIHTSSRSFPLPPVLLARVSTFLPVESVAALAGVSRSWRDFSNTLLANRGFLFEQASSRAGFAEEYRGAIWMRISGAGALAASMSQRASKSAQQNFYEHLVAQTRGYRALLIHQNGLGNRAAPPSEGTSAAAASASSSSSPLSPTAAAIAANVDLEDLSEEARMALDTILKDVPRTLVPANAASRSLISNSIAHTFPEGDQASSPAAAASAVAAGAVSPAARAREELIEKLGNVLSCYCLHDTELGYCQGMNFVAAYLLQHLSEQDSYWLYYKVMQDSAWNLRRFYMNDLHGLLVCKYQFQRLFELYLPTLAAHFRAQEVHSDLFTEWQMTLFTFPSFPRRSGALDRLWDLLLVSRGLKFLFRFSLAILAQAEETLLALEFEDILFYIKQFPDDGLLQVEQLLPLACGERFKGVTNKALRVLEADFEAQCAEEQRQRAQRAEQKKQQAAAKAAQAASSSAAAAAASAAASGASPHR